MGQFVFLTLEGPIFYLCTKFEADSLIRSKVIKGRGKIWKLGRVTQATKNT